MFYSFAWNYAASLLCLKIDFQPLNIWAKIDTTIISTVKNTNDRTHHTG